jgi:hypothetical protein
MAEKLWGSEAGWITVRSPPEKINDPNQIYTVGLKNGQMKVAYIDRGKYWKTLSGQWLADVIVYKRHDLTKSKLEDLYD